MVHLLISTPPDHRSWNSSGFRLHHFKAAGCGEGSSLNEVCWNSNHCRRIPHVQNQHWHVSALCSVSVARFRTTPWNLTDSWGTNSW